MRVYMNRLNALVNMNPQEVYQLDNGSNLLAFDATSGKKLWVKNLGTIQKASPVFADGKIYVGNENGKFYILKPIPPLIVSSLTAAATGLEMITWKFSVSFDGLENFTLIWLYCFKMPSRPPF